jgi:K+-sensing histidine kinase KdpD
MATRNRPGQIIAQALISIAVAAVLVGLATLARAALGPKLGGFSPFMLYVAAVLIAGLVRGPFCGALVMLAGGVAGFSLFLASDGVAPPGSVVALMIFWAVSAPVLVTANELRVQLSRAMAKLSAALDRNSRIAS